MNVHDLQGMHQSLAISSVRVFHEELYVQKAPRESRGIAHEGQSEGKLMGNYEFDSATDNSRAAHVSRQVVGHQAMFNDLIQAI
jgi:hypothetical protein